MRASREPQSSGLSPALVRRNAENQGSIRRPTWKDNPEPHFRVHPTSFSGHSFVSILGAMISPWLWSSYWCSRSQRPWPHCSSLDIYNGAEYHLVFSCPAGQHIRDGYSNLLRPRVSTMVMFLLQDDLVSVVRSFVECLDVLQAAHSSDQSEVAART